MKVAMPTSTPTITIDSDRPSPLDAGCDRFADAVVRVVAGAHCQALPRQEDQQIEREPHRDHDRGRDAGDRDGAARAGADDGVDALAPRSLASAIAAGMS